VLKTFLMSSDYVICILDETKPNVYWEYGCAYGLKKRLMPVVRDDVSVEFNVRQYSNVVYDRYDDAKGYPDLKQKLDNRLTNEGFEKLVREDTSQATE